MQRSQVHILLADQATSRPFLPDLQAIVAEDSEDSLDKDVSIFPEPTHRESVDPPMLNYLCMAISLIEGRRIARKELLEMLV